MSVNDITQRLVIIAVVIAIIILILTGLTGCIIAEKKDDLGNLRIDADCEKNRVKIDLDLDRGTHKVKPTGAIP